MTRATPPSLLPTASAIARLRGQGAGWRAAMAAFLVWAVLLAPTLGFMHRVVHLPASAIPLLASAAAHGHAGQGIEALFADHADKDCRLYDQHCHGGTPLALLLPDLPPPQVDGPRLALHAAPQPRAPAHFEARAPPLRG